MKEIVKIIQISQLLFNQIFSYPFDQKLEVSSPLTENNPRNTIEKSRQFLSPQNRSTEKEKNKKYRSFVYLQQKHKESLMSLQFGQTGEKELDQVNNCGLFVCFLPIVLRSPKSQRQERVQFSSAFLASQKRQSYNLSPFQLFLLTNWYPNTNYFLNSNPITIQTSSASAFLLE